MDQKIEILNGNELIIQGGLESGFSLYTGYPGSPLADYFNILHHKKNEMAEKGIKVVIANSEANAAAMASGAKQAGKDCLVAMKSMGLHVASDALSVGNFANPGEVKVCPETGQSIYPGVVIAVGDDPWSISTSTPADSRYLFKHLHIPFLEPSTPQELKDWMKHALALSKRTSVYQGLLLTTFLAEGGGRVELGTEQEIEKELLTLDPSNFDLSKNVMVPPNSLGADRSMILERFPQVESVLSELALDQKFGFESDIGFISSGVIFETLKQVLEEGDYLDRFSLYKVACSYPLAKDLIVPWLRSKKAIVVVEEKRGFLEGQIKELCQELALDILILGKKFSDDREGFSIYGGLTFEEIKKKVADALGVLGHTPCAGEDSRFVTYDGALPRRLPTFCPGCPHRETLSLLKRLRKKLKEENVDLITHGDVGCYSLSFLPPFKEMHNLSAMGQGGALGAGLDLFTTNPSVVLMGDSTFFHSGLTDISNSIQAEHNITYILLDNDNTAMTGHQMTPASGVNVEGRTRPKQDMLNSVTSLGVDYATEVNPSDRYFYENLLTDVIHKKGVKVIVSNKECGLTFMGRKKRHDRKVFAQGKTIAEQTFFQINTDACEDCRACVEETGCPGLSQAFDAYGSKVTIDPQICVSDSYCTKIKACPSFEEVIVYDYHPTKYQKSSGDDLDLTGTGVALPSAQKTFETIAQGDDLRIVVTGVGGSGVTTISRVLAEAAKEMDGRSDLDFKFIDQKGLAQRNGNVTGHLAIYKKGKSYGAITPNGSADLLVSPDLLDGSQHLRFLSHEGKAIFDEEFQVPLSIMLDNGEEKKPINASELKHNMSELLGERVSFLSLKEACHLILGKSVYASAAILGACFQSGRLPFSLDNLIDAFNRAVPKGEIDNNIKAFHLGRMLFLGEGDNILSRVRPKRKSMLGLLERSVEESMLFWHKKDFVLRRYKDNVNRLLKLYPDFNQEYLARYIHDMYIFDRGVHVGDFIAQATELKEYYSEPSLLKIALRTLAKTYFIKDEVFVSHMMISPMKRLEDDNRFAHLGRSFKLKRINRPAFDVFGKKIEFDVSPTDWMLKTMRHFRLLRAFLPGWHAKEKKIAQKIRKNILNEIPRMHDASVSDVRTQLKKLENIKGYREVRYEKAQGL